MTGTAFESQHLPPEVTAERIELFCRLHQFETWFRELVYVETKARFGSAWWTECQAALKRNQGGGIPADRSLRNDKKHPHMATPENDPLWFISFDALLKIVFDQRLWKLFAPFLTTKQLVRAKMLELMPVRHRIAHARALHADDLDRVTHVISDLDQGFWRFCTSYNHDTPFIAARKQDPVFAHFQDRMHNGYYETSPGQWVSLASRGGASMDTILSLIVRPSAGALGLTSRIAGRRGVLYDAVFSVAHTQQSFNFVDILKATRRDHDKVVHILLHSRSAMLRVTLPALLGEVELKRVLDSFHYACANSRTSLVVRPTPLVAKPEDWVETLRAENRPMRALADQWPHYVIPPDNPWHFLNPDTPCKFFISWM